MTDSELLKRKIKERGITVKWLADKVGISRAALYPKLNNMIPFNQYEIERLCNALELTLREKELIFFATDVDKTVTT
ncbi:helix-turn-helix domain-containing protein [Faecalibaculum rodentium]|uniref:helix-turn-helix domain-containing protein n=1 Tax=Faecalibaculum rodentium TaxID=1702221 RepID=UPI002729FDBD|nr:helix-turn-helix transcriptional regulator [Faecalibaculum rodentium]